MSISNKQLEANRGNAKKGGVKTEKGKEKSRMNSMKHGLLSETMALPGEEFDILMELRINLYKELQPRNQLELILVDRIISSIWRLRRVVRAESIQIAQQFKNFVIDEENDLKDITPLAENLFMSSNFPGLFLRYETAIEKQLYRALNELKQLRNLTYK